ncbi:MAG: WD40/YVTN/BNR-like repeat-containing protein [Anaerolineae bacterium]
MKRKLSKGVPLLLAATAVAGLFIAAVPRAVATFRTLRILEPQPRSEAARVITSEEAWEIAFDYATEWQDDAVLIGLASSDVDDPNAQTSGGDGRRRTWIANLVSPHSSLRIRLQITDGVVVEAIEEQGIFDLPPVTEKPLIDSSDALRSVLAERPDFAPGTGKAQGYHFILQLNEDHQSVLLVLGSYKQSPAIGIVDAETGRVLSYRKHTTDSRGAILYSADAGVTWHISDLANNMVTSMTSDPVRENSAYASVVNDDSIQIYQTQNGGRNWQLLSELPSKAGNWVYSTSAIPPTSAIDNSTVIVVGTPTGLWISRDAHNNYWERVDTLPEGPPQWIAGLGGTETSKIVVSLTAGPNAGLYASEDATSWTKEADGVFRLSKSFNRKSIIAVDEYDESGRALLFDGENMSEITVPPHTLRLAGDFTQSTILLAESPGALFRGTQDAKSGNFVWRENLSTYLASLVVSPDYPSSGLAIAGGFRTGVLRSTDYGESWEEVLSSQALLESGTGEIGSIEFLSCDQVILINGGAFTWAEF